MASAQLHTGNVFEGNQAESNQQQSLDLNNTREAAQATPNNFPENEAGQTSSVGPVGGEHPEGPGNPGEPVPIDGYLPLLLLSGAVLVFYSLKRNKKINI